MKISGMTFTVYDKEYVITSEPYHNVYGSEMMVADCESENSSLQIVFKKSVWDEGSNRYIPVLKTATLMLWCNVELKFRD